VQVRFFAQRQPVTLSHLELALDPNSLLSVCAIAFTSVFALLAFLASAMHLITLLFPASQHEAVDPALVAAVSNTVATVFHGARVTNIEEVK